MMQFKYSLSKKGKIICDGCGKKTAVAYLENETGNFVTGAMKCDRSENCGYHKKPENNNATIQVKEEPIKVTNYLPMSLVVKHYEMGNCHLVNFLLTKFSESELIKAHHFYLLSSINKETIFWQIDQLEQIRSGKVMNYNPLTGKRVKDNEGKASIRWMHKQPYNLKQCLFGLFRVNENKEKIIAIVESEKTAVIMSIYVPHFIWLATGSKSGFKLEYLSPIKNRKIIGFPDKGCFKEWSDKALEMNNFGYNITISSLIENTNCEDGLDIADLYLNQTK